MFFTNRLKIDRKNTSKHNMDAFHSALVAQWNVFLHVFAVPVNGYPIFKESCFRRQRNTSLFINLFLNRARDAKHKVHLCTDRCVQEEMREVQPDSGLM